jgi:hypothetical protein
MVYQQKRLIKMSLLVESEGCTGVQLWVQLEPVFWAEISVSVGDTERLVYPAVCSTKKIALSVPTLAGHESVTCGSA